MNITDYAICFNSVLQNVTGFQIVVEERRVHVLDNGDVNPNK